MHNYLKKLLELKAQGKLPLDGMWHIEILHDDYCGPP